MELYYIFLVFSLLLLAMEYPEDWKKFLSSRPGVHKTILVVVFGFFIISALYNALRVHPFYIHFAKYSHASMEHPELLDSITIEPDENEFILRIKCLIPITIKRLKIELIERKIERKDESLSGVVFNGFEIPRKEVVYIEDVYWGVKKYENRDIKFFPEENGSGEVYFTAGHDCTFMGVTGFVVRVNANKSWSGYLRIIYLEGGMFTARAKKPISIIRQ